jgi:hypothetical protein
MRDYMPTTVHFSQALETATDDRGPASGCRDQTRTLISTAYSACVDLLAKFLRSTLVTLTVTSTASTSPTPATPRLEQGHTFMPYLQNI